MRSQCRCRFPAERSVREAKRRVWFVHTSQFGPDRLSYTRRFPRACVVPAEPNAPDRIDALCSRSYRITVDDGRDSFYALSIEDPEREEAWLMSDTVYALESMR